MPLKRRTCVTLTICCQDVLYMELKKSSFLGVWLSLSFRAIFERCSTPRGLAKAFHWRKRFECGAIGEKVIGESVFECHCSCIFCVFFSSGPNGPNRPVDGIFSASHFFLRRFSVMRGVMLWNYHAVYLLIPKYLTGSGSCSHTEKPFT